MSLFCVTLRTHFKSFFLYTNSYISRIYIHMFHLKNPLFILNRIFNHSTHTQSQHSCVSKFITYKKITYLFVHLDLTLGSIERWIHIWSRIHTARQVLKSVVARRRVVESNRFDGFVCGSFLIEHEWKNDVFYIVAL